MDTFERKLLSLEVLRAIAQTPAPVSLEDAVKFGDARLVQLLIINDVDNVSIDTFYIACNLGQTEIVRLILDLPLERGVTSCASVGETTQAHGICSHAP